MANTVTTLSYANTFGHWLAATDAVINEINILGKGDYTKDSGTLYLNETSQNSLQANGSVIVQKSLNVQGVGSSATIQNNMNVGGQAYFTNATLSIATTGTANVGNTLYALGTGTGLQVSNNALVQGNASIVYGTYTRTLQANATVNTANASITGTTYTNNLQANTFAQTTRLVANNRIETNDLQANTSIVTDVLQANTSVNTASVSATGNVYTKFLQANTSVQTALLVANNTIETGKLQANTSVQTALLVANNTIETGKLQANTSVQTALLVANNRVETAALQANTSVQTALLVSNNRIETAALQANSSIVTATLQANNSVLTGALQANSSVLTGTVQANTSVNTAILKASTQIDANNASAFVGSLQTVGQLSVGGNFVINGTTVYNSNNFTINSGSSTGQISYFNVYRGSSGGSNASIRWNEPSKFFDVANTNTGSYYRLHTDEYLSDAINSVNSTTIATSYAVNAVSNLINSGAGAAGASLYANGAFTQANSAFASANNVLPQVQPAFNQANAAYTRANTSVNSLVSPTGAITPSSGSISFKSNNGITIDATSGNTFSISTPQGLRTTDYVQFDSLKLTQPLSSANGGTGASTTAQALTNLLPAVGSTPAGYVLATGGPGTFYWAAGGTGGGGGATPGTTIQSTRLSYTGTGLVSAYTTPTYTVGASQLRVYIDGVRQFASEYTETSSTQVTLTNPLPNGSALLIEVDGYIVNSYYANNLIYGPVTGAIPSSANTVQLAIDSLESRKAALAGATFTGDVQGITQTTPTSNTSFATTAYVNNLANSSYTFAHSITGTSGGFTAGSATNLNAGSLPAARMPALTGDITTSVGAVATALSTTGVTAASVGSSSYVSQFTVDAKGRISSANSISITAPAGTLTGTTLASGITSSSLTSFGSGIALGTPSSGNLTNCTFPTLNQSTTGRAYPRRSDGNDLNFYWSGQAGQPTWLWGGSNGADMYVYNPSNFSVNYSSQVGISYSNRSNSNYQILWGSGNNVYGTDLLFLNPSSGSLYSYGDITAYYSDMRLKTVTGSISNALYKVNQLSGFIYQPNELAAKFGYKKTDSKAGLSAQDVKKVLPEAVSLAAFDIDENGNSKSGENYLTVHYDKLVPLLIEAIKELTAEVEVLKGQIK